MNKIKILYVVHNVYKKAGVANVIMNYYRKIDHSKFSIDFLIFKNDSVSYEEELKQTGSQVYCLNSSISLFSCFKLSKQIKKFLQENYYDIIELHSPTLSYLVMKNAYLANIPIRIVHSHSTSMSSNQIKNFINHILNINLKKYSNVFFSCSNKSGGYWYGKEIVNSKNYYLIVNGININKFKFDRKKRNCIRNELKIENNKVIGFVGRMSKDKNLLFLANVINSVVEKNNNIKFVMIGDGNQSEKLKLATKKSENNIIFLGMKENVFELLNAFDLLVLPSKREGLPMVAVEAQTCNIKCLLSNTITDEVDIGKTKFIPLKESLWVDAIINEANDNSKIDYDKFDIDMCVKNLEKIYMCLMETKNL